MKECFRCHNWLPLSDFYTHPRMADGHLGKCKACAKQDARDHYSRKMEDPAWAEHERTRNRERMAAQHVGPNWVSPLAPESVKKKARNQLGNALRDGKIIRPLCCADCGATTRKIHGHHLDYFRPLLVVWVCTTCHRRRHATHPERVRRSA